MQNYSNFFRTQINAGGYELVDILDRITSVYSTGHMTTEEFNELHELAVEKANPDNSLAPIEYRFNIILERMAAITDELAGIKTRLSALENGGTAPEDPEEPEEPTIPAWLQPLGAHDAYNTGDRVTFEGNVYESTIDGNVWSPAAYPAGWTEVVVVEEEEEE